MSKLILCQGAYATTPYWIDRGELHVFSIEELCYYIKENVILLDQDFLRMELAEWIQEECKLQELGQELAAHIRQKADFSVCIKGLLQGAKYCAPEEIQEILTQIDENARLNTWEKRKNRIDFLYKSGKYMVALREYDLLKKELGEEDSELSGKISNNIAAIYAHFYDFKIAAGHYLEAYEKDPQEDYFFSYLAAKRMLLSEQEYIDFVAQELQHYDISLRLEKTIENLNGLWEESEEKRMLDELSECRSNQQVGEYYETVERLANQWKDTYRLHVGNSERHL